MHWGFINGQSTVELQTCTNDELAKRAASCAKKGRKEKKRKSKSKKRKAKKYLSSGRGVDEILDIVGGGGGERGKVKLSRVRLQLWYIVFFFFRKWHDPL